MNGSFKERLWALRSELPRCLSTLAGGRALTRFTPPVLEIAADGTSATLRHLERRLHDTSLEALARDTTLSLLLRSFRRPPTLVVPGEWLLQRRLVLPAAAREDLRQVVAYELDRVSPFGADRAFFALEEKPAGGDPGQVAIDLWLLPRSRLQPWLDGLRQAGLPAGRVVAPGLERHNLLPPELRGRPDPLRVATGFLPLLLVLALAGGALALPLWQAEQRVEALRHREQALKEEAQQVLALRRELGQRLEALEQVRERWEATPDPLEILSALSRLLPDDTHLQQLKIRDRELTLRGRSAQASALIALLEQAPEFERPRFLSPVTQQAGKELFHLAVLYRPPPEGRKKP